MRLEDLPEIDLDSEDFKHGVERADASIAHLREGAGIARSQRGVEVFRYDLTQELMRDTRFNIGMHRRLASMGMAEGPVMDVFCNLLVNREGDAHTRMRKACASWFSPKMAERLREEVRALIEAWMDETESEDGIDFQSAVAGRLPAAVFCKLVGEPLDTLEIYERLSSDMLKHAAPLSPATRRSSKAQRWKRTSVCVPSSPHVESSRGRTSCRTCSPTKSVAKSPRKRSSRRSSPS